MSLDDRLAVITVWAPSIYKLSCIAGKLLMINRFTFTSFVGLGLVDKMIAIFIQDKHAVDSNTEIIQQNVR